MDKLGIDEVRRMKYHKQNIHRKLVSICTEPQRDKIRKELSRRLKQFTPYTAHEVKKILGEIYYDVGLERTPKATELEDWLKERYLIRTVRRSGKDAYIIEGDRFMRVV